MATYRLARHLPSPSLLMDTWAGLSDDGRPVLVLRRKEPWAQSPGFFERFAPWLRGWQALRQAEGVLPLLEVGQAGGAVCVVQDFVEGEPLRLALPPPPARPPFSVVESVAVMLQAVRGLLALQHLTPSLVHGDVSATSLLLGVDGVVRLEAIGIAAAHAADPGLGPARSELLCLAPEEVEGQRTPTTDVFRLGLVWLELLTGKTAFGSVSWPEVKTRLEKFPGVMPGHFPNLAQPIPSVLAMMLAKAPGTRPSVSDLELMLTQTYGALGGPEPVSAPLAAAFARVFPGRARLESQLQGGTVLTVSTPSGGLSEGAVKLARISTRRMSADDVNASKSLEAAEAARAAAQDWARRHGADEGNPSDFALGTQLLELQRLTLEQADAALQQAQSLGGTLFYALCVLHAVDEDEVLPIAAGLLKQACLTGPQLLELNLGPAHAAMLARETADDWQVIPLKLEAGGLTVAVVDPARLEVLDDVKRRAKARSITAVRATERTIREGFARIYEGKTALPEWAPRRAPPPSAPRPPPPPSPPPPPRSAPPPPVPAPSAPAPLPDVFPPAPPPSIHPVIGPPPSAPRPDADLSGSFDVASRLFDALLASMGERGLEASAMIALVRAVARQAGATGAQLDQVRLSVTAVVTAALLEGKRAFVVPSRPATAACLGPHWRQFEDFVRPLLDGDETLPSDPRGVVLSLCFEVANTVGAVPRTLSDAATTLDALRSRYPLAALAALEIVLASQ